MTNEPLADDPRTRYDATASAAEGVQWLVMLYLSGDNNLSPQMVRAISDIRVLGGPSSVGVTIQFDPVAPGAPSLRYFLAPGETLVEDHCPAVSEDAANAKTLADFIIYSLVKFPKCANRMLILAGHGSGAVGDFLPDLNADKGRQRSLTLGRLNEALGFAENWTKATPKIQQSLRLNPVDATQPLIDILGMDSCLMSMAEVAYQIRNHVRFFVASEGFVPEAGWPYAHLLKELRGRIDKNGSMDARSLSAAVVCDYLEFYRSYISAGISVDIAALDLNVPAGGSDDGERQESGGSATVPRGLEAVAVALKGLIDELGNLLDPNVQNAVILSHWRAQSFKFEQYTDLWDFCDLLRKELLRYGSYPAITAACEDVQRSVNVLVGRRPDRWITHSLLGSGSAADPKGAAANDGRQGVEGIEFQHARGLSVYFPWSLPCGGAAVRKSESALEVEKLGCPKLEQYAELDFAAQSGWSRFLATYLTATMRPPRNDEALVEVTTAIYATAAGAAVHNPGAAPVAGALTTGVRFAPEMGRFAPEMGRLLTSIVGGAVSGSMKNGPQQHGVATAPTECGKP